MASPVLQQNPAISRDETSGNNLGIYQLNMIDAGDDAGAAGNLVRTVPSAPNSPVRRYVESHYDDESDLSDSSHYSRGVLTPKTRIVLGSRIGTRALMVSNEVTTRRRSESPQPPPLSVPRMKGEYTTVESESDIDSPRISRKYVVRKRERKSYPKGVTDEDRTRREAPSSPSSQDEAESRSSAVVDQAPDTKMDILVLRKAHTESSEPENSELREEIERLRRELDRMRGLQESHVFSAQPSQPAQPAATYRTFYYIGSTCYLDEPHWEPGDDGSTVLKSESPIRSLSNFLDQHPDIAFAVIKEYDSHPPRDRTKIERKDGVYRIPEPTTQFLNLISDAMIDAVEELIDRVPRFRSFFPGFNTRKSINSPYLFMFHSAPYLSNILPDVDPVSRFLLIQLEKCIRKSHGFEHDSAESQAKKGRVSNDLFGYLIRPGDVLVERAGPLTQAYIAMDWAKEQAESQRARRDDKLYDQLNARKGVPTKGWDPLKQEERQTFYEWRVPVWSWAFDGNFQERQVMLEVGVKAGYSAEIVSIDQLKIIPLRYATRAVRAQLEKRGKMFWTLRYKRFINYQQSGDGDLSSVADRFMVDVETYKMLHPASQTSKMRLRSSLSPKEMMSDEPPPGEELLVFPPQIVGFNLLRKSWMDLYVDYMSAITWNKQAFADLVVDDETKELVQALVMKQLTAEKSTDFVNGKGNGLILLLHGGPGTGKTFTAEGVAEFAEKPLLRVTCGDVGTVAEVVEKKLQSSFHLGKIWDCVVLLDEADVFLEERDMKDLNRNALVSVFLRELEYYDGILILTSNRVGTFDEAFKSRIQLSLHYENLGVTQRRKIWRNFIKRVRTLDPTIDYDDIMDNLDQLSGAGMNGREIRNAITTARQLAQFKEKALSYAHLSHVLRVNRKFSTYLHDLRDGLTEDDIKRDSGLRLTYKSPAKDRSKESPF